MYIAFGMNTMKVYAMGNSKSMLMQRLEKKYPYNQQKGATYPEPLLLHKKEGK